MNKGNNNNHYLIQLSYTIYNYIAIQITVKKWAEEDEVTEVEVVGVEGDLTVVAEVKLAVAVEVAEVVDMQQVQVAPNQMTHSGTRQLPT